MAILELSAGVMQNMSQRMIFPTSAQSYASSGSMSSTSIYLNPLLPYNWSIPTGGVKYQSGIYIYKGTVPVDLSTLTSSNARSADLLISFENRESSTFINTIIVSTNPAVINTTFINASASGTASWFRWMVMDPPGYGTAVSQQIVGTVGLQGSGSDLEMSTTDIVSGQPYRIQNLRVQFPSTWTYT